MTIYRFQNKGRPVWTDYLTPFKSQSVNQTCGMFMCINIVIKLLIEENGRNFELRF